MNQMTYPPPQRATQASVPVPSQGIVTSQPIRFQVHANTEAHDNTQTLDDSTSTSSKSDITMGEDVESFHEIAEGPQWLNKAEEADLAEQDARIAEESRASGEPERKRMKFSGPIGRNFNRYDRSSHTSATGKRRKLPNAVRGLTSLTDLPAAPMETSEADKGKGKQVEREGSQPPHDNKGPDPVRRRKFVRTKPLIPISELNKST